MGLIDQGIKFQERIAQSAIAIKEEARCLLKEAADELEKVKQVVEAPILGEGDSAPVSFTLPFSLVSKPSPALNQKRSNSKRWNNAKGGMR